MRYKLIIFILLLLLGGYLCYPSSLDFILGKPDWERLIVSGREFALRLDNTTGKFDDSKYSGEVVSDPMGRIKGGENYVIKYTPETGYIGTGLNQETGRIDTFPCSAKKPLPPGCICLWERTLPISINGDVADIDFGIIGHLDKVSIIDTIKNKLGTYGARWVKIEGDYADSNCFLYCAKISKKCASSGCPKGPPPCQTEGGMAQVELNGKPTCKNTWERDCRVLIDRPTRYSNFYCCCQ
jgi:hypothetical protein